MIKKTLRRCFYALSLTMILATALPACSPAGNPTAVTETVSAVTPSPEASPTRKPTFTPPPTATIYILPTATSTPTVSPTATLVPPPDDFSSIKLISYGQLPDWNFQFTFEFPAPVKGNYLVETIDPKKEFPCRPLLEYKLPKRMICLGRTPAVEKYVDYIVKSADTGEVLYAGKISIIFQ